MNKNQAGRVTLPKAPAVGSPHGALEYSVAHIIELLQRYQEHCNAMTLRERTTVVAQIQEAVRQLGISIGVRAGFSPTSGKERVRSYLLAAPNEVIDGKELAVISGVADYGRRVREIRGAGFTIRTGLNANDPSTGAPLQPDQYLLVPEGPGRTEKPFR
jgi:hypothetical protein